MRLNAFNALLIGLCTITQWWNWSYSAVVSEACCGNGPAAAVRWQNISKQEIQISNEAIDAQKFTYAGCVIRKHHRKMRIDNAVEKGRPFFADDEYATLNCKGRTVLKFDDGTDSPVGNVLEFGLFSFLGATRKQLFVSQDTFRGGRQWVARLNRSPQIIYDGRAWATGRELDDMNVVDLDGDGIYEISVPTTIFYGFANLSPAETPLPTIIFKYSTKSKRYLPANPHFVEYLLAGIEDQKLRVHPPGDQMQNRTHLSDVLSIVLDYVFAGREKEAWTFYQRAYKLPDKTKVRRDIRAELRASPVYRFIYNRHNRHRHF